MGTVLPLDGAATAAVADPRNRLLAVAVRQPPSMALFPLDDPTAAPRTVPLPGEADALTLAADGGSVLASIPATRQLLRIDLPTAATTAISVDGAPAGVSQLGQDTLVAVRDRKAVDVVTGDRVRRSITGNLYGADQVLTVRDHAVVLDRARTALFDLDVKAGTIGTGQRAGEGATNAITDRFGRVLVVDTRGGALLAFSVDPILMRQRYPVPGAPYGIAYDPKRDLAWVTLTERNEVVGYDVAGGEPEERFRFPTVRQPNSVAVDPETGRVFVASADGGGVQVMRS